MRRAIASQTPWRDGVSAAYARIEAQERHLQAWATTHKPTAIAPPRGDATNIPSSPLFGIPVGIKDVIDTADLATEYGSPIYAGHQPAADAACVARIREAGGVIVGKTATTEFATRQPCATRNPHNPDHTPGGSSSGSAAAVAAGMVPIALGTQTLGSVIRPAAYCGVCAIKPTFGRINRAGVKLLSESVDTVGIFARTVADLGLALGAIADRQELIGFALGTRSTQRPRLAFCRSPQWTQAEAHGRAHFERLAEVIGRVMKAPQVTLSVLDPLEVAVDTITEFEIFRGLSYERSAKWHLCSGPLRELFAKGADRTWTDYETALARAEAARAEFDSAFADFDALVTPSAPGEAPAGLGNTGPATFNKIWTLLHAPTVTIPAGRGPNGLPLGLQIVARRGRDLTALEAAQHLHDLMSESGALA